jgi:hypothetical protein
MTTDDSRLRAAFTVLAETAKPTDACPPAERLWAAARGELIPETTQEVVLHTATCGVCAEAWRLAVDVAREAGESTRAAPRRSRRRWLAGAGAAVVAAAALLLFLLWKREEEPIYRGDPSAIASRLDEAVPLPRDAAVLRWTSAGEGARYTIRVSSEDFDLLWEQPDVTATEITVPAAALAAVPAGKRVLWQVEAVRSDGARVASPTFFAALR